MSHQPVFHYFDCRGRGQGIRYFLRDHEIAFDDRRVPLTDILQTWPSIKDDKARTGPFRKLPYFCDGPNKVAETMAICTYLERRCQLETSHSADSLMSSVMWDVIVPLGQLVWADYAFPNIDIDAFAAQTTQRYLGTLDDIEDFLGEHEAQHPIADGAKARMCDYFLYEGIEFGRDVLGKVLEERLARYSKLCALVEWINGTDAVKRELREHPDTQWTGRPGEIDAIAHRRKVIEAR